MEESELIDSYLKGELNEESLMLFESRLQRDSSFKGKVELRRLIIDSINIAYQEELKDKLKAFDKTINKKSRQLFSPMAMAASIVFFMVTVTGIYLFLNRSTSRLNSYDLYDSGIPNQMGASENIELSNAMNFFKAREYAEALEGFNKLNPTDTVLYYAGICSFRLGQPDKAIKLFKEIDKESEYFLKAKYRMGLSLWNKNETDKALPIFIELASDTTNEYGKNAKKILIEGF